MDMLWRLINCRIIIIIILFSGRSLYLLEHFARWHSVCTISFCLL